MSSSPGVLDLCLAFGHPLTVLLSPFLNLSPTKDPMNETNLLDLRLFPLAPLPEALEVVARGQVPNARLGGCFDLSIKFTLQDSENQNDSQMNPTSIRIGMLKVILIQLANVKSIRESLLPSKQGSFQTKLALMSSNCSSIYEQTGTCGLQTNNKF